MEFLAAGEQERLAYFVHMTACLPHESIMAQRSLEVENKVHWIVPIDY